MMKIASAPIVILHGWGMNKQVWNGVLELMPEEFRARVQVLDLPGYGTNKTVPNPYSIDALSDWLNTQIIKSSYVFGWSLGGLVAMKFAVDYPDKVLSLGLIASTPKFQQDNNWPGIRSDVLSAFSEQLVKNHQQTIQRFLAIQAMGSQTSKQDLKLLKEWILSAEQPDHSALAGGLELLKSVDLREQIETLSVPVAGIFGRLDSLVPVAAVKLLQKQLPNADLTVCEHVSHAPFISEPEQFVQWLMSHCTKVS